MFYLWLLNSLKMCLNLSPFFRLPKRGSKGRQLHDRQYKICKAITKVTELWTDNRQYWFNCPGRGSRIPPSTCRPDMSGEQPLRVKRPKLQNDQSVSSYMEVKISFTTSPLSRNGALKCKPEGTHPKEYTCTEWPAASRSAA